MSTLSYVIVTGCPCPVRVSVSVPFRMKSPLAPMYQPSTSAAKCPAPPYGGGYPLFEPRCRWPHPANWASAVLSLSNSAHPQNPPRPVAPQIEGLLQFIEIPI